jgi:hypothetical protein
VRKTASPAKKIDDLRLIVKRPDMQIRVPCAAVLVAALAGASARAAAAPAEEKRLLILEAPGNVLTKVARERLQAAIAEVATGHGLILASVKSLPDKLLGCELPGCLPPIAAASGAIFVLRVEARFVKESFKLSVELWNSDEGKLLGRERRDCPICDEQDLWGSAALMSQGLLARALREPSKPAVVQPPNPVASSGPAPAVAQLPGPPPSRALPYAGLALSVVGLAALVTGIYYWGVDGDPACSRCDDLRDTRKFGLPLTVAGGVVLATGVGLLGWSLRAGPANISLSPAGLRVAGQFR